MKTLLALLVALVTCASIQAQELRFKIVLKDGQELVHSIDSISSIKFTKNLALPDYRAMRFTPHRMTDVYFDHVYPSDIDSIHFSTKSGYPIMDLTPIEGELIGNEFHDSRMHVDPMYYGQGRDSLTFHTFSKNDKLAEVPDYNVPLDYAHNGDYLRSSGWSNGQFYAGDRIRRIELNDDLSIRTDVLIDSESSSYFEFSSSGTKMLIIRPESIKYPVELEGQLVELDLLTLRQDTLVADTVVSSARYLPGTPDIIYFSYGKRMLLGSPGAGFFRWSAASRASTFLFKPVGYRGGYTPIGFDITGDGKKLLYSSSESVIEYDLNSRVFDTIIKIEGRYVDWVEYSHANDRIIYSTDLSYNEVLQHYLPAEVGIINRQARTSSPIRVAPDDEMPWHLIMPRWSTDDKAISFSAGMQVQASMHPMVYQRLYIMKLED